MLATNAGTYQARPLKWRVGKSKGGALELAVEFMLYGVWDGTQWVQEDSNITGYFYLVTKEGKLNDDPDKKRGTVTSVENAFGWNRANGFAWLSDAQELPDCQVVLDFESDDKGGQRLRVKWLNTLDRDPNAGGVGASDPQEVKSLDAQFGHLLRATARRQPSKPQGNVPSPENPLEVAKREAWKKFQVLHNGKTKEEMANAWKNALAEYFDGKPANGLGAKQFDQFATDEFRKPEVVTSPVSEEEQFTESEIPFDQGR